MVLLRRTSLVLCDVLHDGGRGLAGRCMIRHFLAAARKPLAVALLSPSMQQSAARLALIVGAVPTARVLARLLAARSEEAVPLPSVAATAQLHLRQAAKADEDAIVRPHRVGRQRKARRYERGMR